MGKVLGGGSSINVMAWARGHKNDWDFFASESGETAWNYESVLNIYRRMEDWRGAPHPTRRRPRGGGFARPPPAPQPPRPPPGGMRRSLARTPLCCATKRPSE